MSPLSVEGGFYMVGSSIARSRRVAVAVRFTLSLAAACLSNLAQAQGAPAPAEPEAQNAPDLQEIVVTAQFRRQNVQDTPLAITAMSGETLEARSQNSIAEIAGQVPNVALKQNSAAFGPSLGASIRGVGQFDFNPALEPGVGLYVDDVYYATLTGSILDLLDLDRIEILRGPQGTLAGKNSIGGAVKLYSKQPTGEGGYVSGTYGSRNRVDLRASGDFAIADNLFARISGVSKQQRGYVEIRDYGCYFPNSGVPALRSPDSGCVTGYGGEVNYSAVRGALRWKASDSLQINAAIDYTHDDRAAAAGVLQQGSTTVSPNAQPVPGAATGLSAADFVPPPGSYYNYATFFNPAGTYQYLSGPNAGKTLPMVENRADGRVKFDGWGASTTIDWQLADKLSLKSITAYRAYDSYFSNDNDLSPLASSLGYGYLTFNSLSEELRLSGALLSDRIQYTLGGFYLDENTIYATTQDLRYSPTSLTQFQGHDPVNADTEAVFSQLSFLLTSKLTLNGGLRYTKEHKDYTFSRHDRSGNVPPAFAAINGITTNYDGSKVDYRVNVQYTWADSVMTYAQVATGFKGGGVTPRPFTAAQARPFNPEEMISYEAGLKSDFFGRRMRVNLAAFFSKYEDIQLSLSSCPQFGAGLPCAVIANAGNADMKGVELETTIRPLDHLSIDASASYIDFDYTWIDPATGAGGPQYGDYPIYTPKAKASLGIQYDLGLADRGVLTARADATYQTESYANGRNAPTNLIRPYALFNARLTWRNEKGTWETSLEGTNLANKYYFITRFDQYTTTGVTDGQPGRPREWAVTVRRNF